MSKKAKIIWSIIVIVVLVLVGGYFYGTNAVAHKVPGHVYEYMSVSGNNKVYMSFSKDSDQAIVTSQKSDAVKSAQSKSNFDDIYQKEMKNGCWQYLAKGSHLTLTKTQGGKTSRWQYNNCFALGNRIHSRSFTYQIVNAGQGVDRKATNFVRVK